MSCVRDNERYLAFPPAVSQAFLVHSGEVRHKIVGHKKVTLENKNYSKCAKHFRRPGTGEPVSAENNYGVPS